MLRRALIAASTSDRLRSLAMDQTLARKVADRFVAGESLDEALEVTSDLNAAGMSVTLDYLGESVDDPSLAEAAAQVYLDGLERIAAQGLDCSVSVKPTQVGMDLSDDLCERLMASICDAAAEIGTHVTIDMEGTAHTQRTVDLVLKLRASGRDNVGCAVQSYLHRTLDDIADLTAQGASLRLCKGAYAEPEEVAFQSKEDVDANYVRAAEVLLTSGTFGRFATHDHRIIEQVRNLARRLEVGDDTYEFQMLYGVREPLQREIVQQGHGMRIYVPFGDQWYPYFMRRLAERPANLVFFLRALTGSR